MNVSVRVDHVHTKALGFEGAPSVSNSAKANHRDAETNSSSPMTLIALGFGGILTVTWAGILVWSAGYVVGLW
jgi:hypothetical protein